ncbi:PNKP [Symbiodinium natans]|uniref:PNKP protein n=1 Tax=Symbiodinium natans TaxID=878477 RepID=A0A812RIR6_9DINO|nr:PNKP [Symbiodinium natans]
MGQCLEASRGGTVVEGQNGLERRAVVDFQPPRSVRGEILEEGEEGWEKLPGGDRMALELEPEDPGECWGVWLFAGGRFARILGPPIGCSASSIASTCCRSLAILRRLSGPKANLQVERFKADVGEVTRCGYLQQMLPQGPVPCFDKDDAARTGSIQVEDGVVLHKLPSGTVQRWKIHEMTFNPFGEELSNRVGQVAEEVLAVGSKVQYWSTTVERWVSATVLARNEDGSYRLDIKKRAPRQFIKEEAATEESKVAKPTRQPKQPAPSTVPNGQGGGSACPKPKESKEEGKKEGKKEAIKAFKEAFAPKLRRAPSPSSSPVETKKLKEGKEEKKKEKAKMTRNTSKTLRNAKNTEKSKEKRKKRPKSSSSASSAQHSKKPKGSAKHSKSTDSEDSEGSEDSSESESQDARSRRESSTSSSADSASS